MPDEQADEIIDLIEKMVAESVPFCSDLPVVGVDECMNRGDLYKFLKRPTLGHRVYDVVRLWHQLRQRNDGSLLTLQGGFRIARTETELGLPVKRWSTPDQHVMYMLVGNLQISGKAIFLTENVKRNRNGVVQLLQDVVQPAMRKSDRNRRYSLLALIKKPRTNFPAYLEGVEEAIVEARFKPGCTVSFV